VFVTLGDGKPIIIELQNILQKKMLNSHITKDASLVSYSKVGSLFLL